MMTTFPSEYKRIKAIMQGSEPNADALDMWKRIAIRLHSQKRAIEVLKLKAALNQLGIEDLSPSKLRSLADYFDSDVLGVTQ